MGRDKKFIPVCEPYLTGKELEYVTDAVKTGWISGVGSYVKKFEEEFARFCGVKHAISTNNGTAALHLALVGLGIKDNDEVIIPNFTMISSAFSVCYTGAKPVFVDADEETWNINPNWIEERITPKTRAIMPVHIYGHPCEMDKIMEIARKYNLKVIEDCAEAHGAEYKGKKVGSFGDVGCFSFYSNKIITTGEGGMIVTNNDDIAERCKYHKNLCFPLDGSRNYLHEDIGFNYRMSNVVAAIGFAQLEKIERYIKKRRENHELYISFLGDVNGIIFQPEKKGCKNVYWMNGIVIDPKKAGITKDELTKKLACYGIETRNFFVGMHKQPSLKNGSSFNEKYAISEWLEENGFYIPSGSGLKGGKIKYISNKIKEIIRASKKTSLERRI
jgi:perosamine synthetase